MRHWKGQAAVNSFNQSKHSWSWVGAVLESSHIYIPTRNSKTACGDQFRHRIPISTLSNHSLYTYDETLEGSSCCQWLELVQKHLILVSRVGVWNWNYHRAWLKSQVAVMSIGNVFHSQPCMTINYTYSETLEGSSRCKFLESVPALSILSGCGSRF